ncbi:MAG: methyltransferase domain-containing protein [Verrucomicrobiota bacterium]|nr:methyltransferase domain-containing protein [Verrucomicrobiota bacterium]
MIETSNPEIDVDKLMERIRREAAKIAAPPPRARVARQTRAQIAAPTMPPVPDPVVPPVVGLSAAIDDKRTRTDEMLRRARQMIEVPTWVPKSLRWLFRKQGGYNRTLLDTVAQLAKTNHQLNHRVQELATAMFQQNDALRTLAQQQRLEANWMRAALPVFADVQQLQGEMQRVAEQADRVPDLITTSDEMRAQLGDLREQLGTVSGRSDKLREQLERHGEHLRYLQDESVQNRAAIKGWSERLARDGTHLRHLQDESDRHSDAIKGWSEQLERDGIHLRHLQDESDRHGDAITGWSEQLQRDSTHLRHLQDRTTQQGEAIKGWSEQLQRDGEHLRNLQVEVERVTAQVSDRQMVEATEQRLRDLQAQADRAGEHLRHLQDDLDRRVQDVRNVQHMLARVEEHQVNDAIYIKGQLSHQQTLWQQWLAGAKQTGDDDAPGSPREVLASVAKVDAHRLDAFYLSFENRFRGTREEIRERVRFYLPFLRDAGAAAAGETVLDVGCGRGEWLELLKEEGFDAAGIDLNSAMVAQCRARGLVATEGDAIDVLRSLPDGSHAAVTGFHIIEHLPLEVLMDLFAETLRVLRPGGIAIFESPNCKNLVVGACNFNVDPTHRNPVFPETAEFMMSTQGFGDIRLEYLSPVDTRSVAELKKIPEAVRQLLYGPQDFAVIARKPARA